MRKARDSLTRLLDLGPQLCDRCGPSGTLRPGVDMLASMVWRTPMKIVLDDALAEAIRAAGHANLDEYVHGLIRADLEGAGLIPRGSQSTARESSVRSTQPDQSSGASEARADA